MQKYLQFLHSDPYISALLFIISYLERYSMTLCTRCKKRPAVVFLQRYDMSGKTGPMSEGLCLLCAKELGIAPVNDMLEKMGIDEEQLENMSDEISGMMENPDFFGGMMPFGNMDGMIGADSEETEQDADENALVSPENAPENDKHAETGESDSDEPEENETRAPSVNLGSIFGNL